MCKLHSLSVVCILLSKLKLDHSCLAIFTLRTKSYADSYDRRQQRNIIIVFHLCEMKRHRLTFYSIQECLLASLVRQRDNGEEKNDF